ncbi:MAG: hypothetical protein ACRD3K_04985 [Edaphobacter sp.]
MKTISLEPKHGWADELQFHQHRTRGRAGRLGKSSVVTTAIEGRVLLFKEIGRNEHRVHSEFKELPDGITVGLAVGMLLR